MSRQKCWRWGWWRFSGPAGAAGALKGFTGIRPSPEAALLVSKGIDLTPGQLNKGGILDQLETAFENVPIIGQIIKAPKDQVEKDAFHIAVQLAQANALMQLVTLTTSNEFDMLQKSTESVLDGTVPTSQDTNNQELNKE